MMKTTVISLSILFLFALAEVGAQSNVTTKNGPVQVLQNQWALGIDNAVGCTTSKTSETYTGWQKNEFISWSKCPKNPAPPDGTTNGGAAFKNGTANGRGVIGQEARLWQDFNLQNRGVSAASNYNFRLSAWGVGVRTEYNKFRLYGSDDGQNWALLDDSLLDIPNSGGRTSFDLYESPEKTFGHYKFYRLSWGSLYTKATPGAKVTGISLFVEPAKPPPPPTAASTPVKTIDRCLNGQSATLKKEVLDTLRSVCVPM